MAEVKVLDDFFESKRPIKNIEYIEDENNCFICISHAQNPSKYYKIKRDSKNYDLHVWIYERYHGERKKGMVVRHTCNNQNCINPSHLVLGTYRENAMDSINDKRNFITEDIAIKVRELIATGLKQYEVANILNLKVGHVSKIHNRTIWNL